MIDVFIALQQKGILAIIFIAHTFDVPALVEVGTALKVQSQIDFLVYQEESRVFVLFHISRFCFMQAKLYRLCALFRDGMGKRKGVC